MQGGIEFVFSSWWNFDQHLGKQHGDNWVGVDEVLEILHWLDQWKIGNLGLTDDAVDMVPNYMKISGEPATNAVCSWVDGMMTVDWWSKIHGEVEELRLSVDV